MDDKSSRKNQGWQKDCCICWKKDMPMRLSLCTAGSLASPWMLALLWMLVGCGPPAGYRVACVGDSITFGAALTDPEEESYPAQLQRMLGDSAVVRNFGRNSRTMLRKGDAPYWEEASLEEALALAPQVVVIMLGTNDSRAKNWVHAAEFMPDYLAMIDTFLALPQPPRVLVCLPPPVYPHDSPIEEDILQRQIVPAIRRVAAQRPVDVIDFQESMADHAEWFPDGVHPSAAGAAHMAEVIAKHIATLPGAPLSASLP
jgi:lysophospholipase L1-like esterase